jgi:hypothetical protein
MTLAATSMEQQKSSSAYPISKFGGSSVSGFEITSINTIKSRSISLFREMVSGDMSSFAAQFGKLVWDGMPSQFLGRKEYVYQAYVCAYFTAASDASTALNHRNKWAWDVRVEENAGIGRLDLILQRMGDHQQNLRLLI